MDVLLKDGLVARVSATGFGGDLTGGGEVEKIDVAGKWVTPGIVGKFSLSSYQVRNEANTLHA